MPIFVTRTLNSTFASADEGVEYPDLDAAYAAAITAAAHIGVEEIRGGANVAMLEICIEEPSGKALARGVVSVSTARLDGV